MLRTSDPLVHHLVLHLSREEKEEGRLWFALHYVCNVHSPNCDCSTSSALLSLSKEVDLRRVSLSGAWTLQTQFHDDGHRQDDELNE